MDNLTHYNYIFFKLLPEIFEIPEKTMSVYKEEFIQIIEKHANVRIYGYSTLGLKNSTAMMFWIQSASIENMQVVLQNLLHTNLGKYLEISYTLSGIKRRSSYGNKGTAETQEVENNKRARYLIVYPFTKTTEWYQLPFEARKELMHEHIKTGYKYAHIKQYLLYAIGIDDHEFIVSYETENLEDFQSLVMDMRSTKVRMYTQSDTPIFTCVHKPIPELLDTL